MFHSVLIYFFTFIFSILISFIYQKLNNKFFKFIFGFLVIFFPVLIATFRFNVGTDYFGYLESYNVIKRSIFSLSDVLSYYQEPLHIVINLIAYKVFDSYNGFLFLASLIFMIFNLKAISKYSKEISIPFALYIFFMTIYHLEYNCTRQMIAVSIVFYALNYIYDRKLFKYVFFVFLASLFHKSAIICILFYLLWRDNGNSKKSFSIMLVIFTIIIPLLQGPIISFCEKLGIYHTYISDVTTTTTTYGFLLYILPLLLLYVFNKKNIIDNTGKLKFFFRLYVLQIPLQLLGNYIPFADRLSMYLLPVQIIMFPLMIKNIKYNKKLNYIIIVVWYIIYYYIMFIALRSNEVYPYTWLS